MTTKQIIAEILETAQQLEDAYVCHVHFNYSTYPDSLHVGAWIGEIPVDPNWRFDFHALSGPSTSSHESVLVEFRAWLRETFGFTFTPGSQDTSPTTASVTSQDSRPAAGA